VIFCDQCATKDFFAIFFRIDRIEALNKDAPILIAFAPQFS
jgi:hypothetical protein